MAVEDNLRQIFECTKDEAEEVLKIINRNYKVIRTISEKKKREMINTASEKIILPYVKNNEDIDIVLTALSIISTSEEASDDLLEVERYITREMYRLN